MITVDSLVEQLQKQLDDHQNAITKLTGAIEVLRSLKAQGLTQISQGTNNDQLAAS